MNQHVGVIRRYDGHRYITRVYYEDTDAGGVVYHAAYLGMAERARTEALRDIGAAHADMTYLHGLAFLVRRVSLDYAAPARLDDLLTIVTSMNALHGASMRLQQKFFHAGTATNRPLLMADVQLACVRLADMRPARIPDRWRAALALLAERED